MGSLRPPHQAVLGRFVKEEHPDEPQHGGIGFFGRQPFVQDVAVYADEKAANVEFSTLAIFTLLSTFRSVGTI